MEQCPCCKQEVMPKCTRCRDTGVIFSWNSTGRVETPCGCKPIVENDK